MADIVNLRTARKQAKRRQAEQDGRFQQALRTAARRPNAPSISRVATRPAKD